MFSITMRLFPVPCQINKPFNQSASVSYGKPQQTQGTAALVWRRARTQPQNYGNQKHHHSIFHNTPATCNISTHKTYTFQELLHFQSLSLKLWQKRMRQKITPPLYNCNSMRSKADGIIYTKNGNRVKKLNVKFRKVRA